MVGRNLALSATIALAALAAASSAYAMPPPPSASQCAATRAHRSLPTVRALDPRPGAPRVFAMQFKQEIRHVVTYATYRTKIECLIRTRVVPLLARGRPNVVVFNEDVGLATIATGSRGAAARSLFATPAGTPSCEGEGAPCATLAALGLIDTGYARELAYYRARFPSLGAASGAFVAATDTFARGWMQTFSDMARRYRVYIAGSNSQALFRESTDPADIAALADPDMARPHSVFVATSPDVHNEAFAWGPRDVRRAGPPMLRNVVESNLKVPLTSLELQLGLTPGPSTGPAARANLEPYALPGTRARLGIATSLPAFAYGAPPPGFDPCADTADYYMRCLDRLGANVVLQDEANPGRWAGTGASYWQPLEWMGSAWRAAADASVRFAYSVNPMMVGNLADLAFDGQSAITQRGLRGASCRYIGDASLVPSDGDPAAAAASAGDKPQFLALARWVTPDADRATLRATGARLAPGSRDALENDYAETVLAADLPLPRDPRRRGCVGVRPPPAARIGATVRPRRALRGRRTRFVFTVREIAGGRQAPLAGARVRFAGRSAVTDRRGRARIVAALRRTGVAVATVAERGLHSLRIPISVISAHRRKDG